jgi:hypothetical protein
LALTCVDRVAAASGADGTFFENGWRLVEESDRRPIIRHQYQGNAYALFDQKQNRCSQPEAWYANYAQ